jgi:hypothetical protein
MPFFPHANQFGVYGGNFIDSPNAVNQQEIQLNGNVSGNTTVFHGHCKSAAIEVPGQISQLMVSVATFNSYANQYSTTVHSNSRWPGVIILIRF